jgi:hypothetical protein
MSARKRDKAADRFFMNRSVYALLTPAVQADVDRYIDEGRIVLVDRRPSGSAPGLAGAIQA